MEGYPGYHGRRLHGGGSISAAVAAQYSFVALYNDSTIGHLLRVLWWAAAAGVANGIVARFTSGTIGTIVSTGINLFAGEQLGAGSIYSGSQVAAPGFGLYVDFAGGSTSAVELKPWFYVRPGYSLVFSGDTVNLVASASFIWEDLDAGWLCHSEMV